MNPSAHTCSASSLAAGEPLAGTAVERVNTWILVEVSDGWGRKGVEDTAMPEALRAQLLRAAALPAVRPQLIRRPGGPGQRVAAFVVRSGAVETVEHLSAENLDALSSVDLVSWVAGEGEPPAGATRSAASEAPLILVCAHGKRDRCCAEHGVALFTALERELGDAVWQSSHLNGHRFAATAVVFPGGWQYGRLGVDDASGLAAAVRGRRLYRLDRARGRTSQSNAVQAAELAWRALDPSARSTLDAPSIDVEETSGDTIVTVSGKRFRVTQAPSPTSLVQSCGTEPATPPRWSASLLATSPGARTMV